MAVTFTHLATGSDTSNTTSYTTGTISPSANRILYAAVFATAPSGQTTVAPSLTGTMGLTWDLVRQAPASDAIRTMYWFRSATGGTAPTPGTLTFDFGSQSLTGAMWGVYEAAGADMSGTNGAGATVQSVEERRTGGANTSVSFAFPSTVDTANGTLAMIGITANATITPGTGWTSVGGTTTYTGPNQAFIAMHGNTAVQTIAASWSGGANTWTIGVEVKAASGSTPGQGTASGSWSYTGAASGKRTPKATGSGSFAYGGTATGVSARRGTASGTWAFTGAATGKRAPKATASGSFAFAGAATGSAPAMGVADGTATGAWAFAGAAVGAAVYSGTAAGQFAWAGTAAGTAPAVAVKSGTAVGAWGYVGAAAGASATPSHTPGSAALLAPVGTAVLAGGGQSASAVSASPGTAAIAPHVGAATLHTT